MRRYEMRQDLSNKVLIEIECDSCGATIRPGKEVSADGWVNAGSLHDINTGDYLNSFDFCPECAWRDIA